MVISQPPPLTGGLTMPHHMNKPPPPNGQHPSSLIIDSNSGLIDIDGKRLRKTMMRKTIDYNSSFLNMIQNRIWQRDHRDRRAIQPDICYYPAIVPPQNYKENPVNAVTTRFVKTATNKMRCPIFCLSWTPEGRRLITGASSGEFTLWNGLTFNFETILQAHDSPVRAMKWSNNESWMVTGDHGGYIKYWQSNMNNVKMFQAHKEPVRQVSFSPTDTKFASCSDDGTVRIWDFQQCVEERVLRGHGSDVKCCDWHPQKGIVVSGSKDNQQPLKLWDPRNGTVLSTIHAHKSTVMDCRWNKNGNWLITASRDHLLKLFDIRNLKEEIQTFRGHKKEASAVAWHPIHEGMFASGGSDGSIIFWSVNQEKEVGVIEQAHDSIVWTLVWHPAGHILTTGSNDHTVKFWSRNRPGDPMRDKYNLNTLPPGVEEDCGNLGDLYDKKIGHGLIPGMDPEDRVDKSEIKLSIPGLDVQVAPEEFEQRKFVAPLKPISRTFQAAWADAKLDDRGVKRLFGDKDVGVISVSNHGPLKQETRKENMHPTKAITLSQLQQEATVVVAKGQIIPVLPGGPLYQSIGAGEMAIRDVLFREFSIGGRPMAGASSAIGGLSHIPGRDYGPPNFPPNHLGPPPTGLLGNHQGMVPPHHGPPSGQGPPPGHGLPSQGHPPTSHQGGGGWNNSFDRPRREEDNFGRRQNNWGGGGGGRSGGRGGRM